jgi:hypothetical protein
MGPLQQHAGLNLDCPQCGSGVGREERIARPTSKNHDATFFKVSHRTTANVGLSNLRHLDRRLDSGGLTQLFKRVLQRECIDDRCEHAHVIGLRAIHSGTSTGHSSPDVSTTDNDGDFNIGMVCTHIDNVFGNALHNMAVNAVTGIASESFARNLEQNPRPAGGRGWHQAPM